MSGPQGSRIAAVSAPTAGAVPQATRYRSVATISTRRWVRRVRMPVSSGANLPVSLLRWNGTAWENNAADVCTGSLNLGYGNYRGGLQSSDLNPMPPTVGTGGGAGTVSLQAPNKAGSVDVTLLGVPSHLTEVQPGDPKATATFSNSAATGQGQNNRVFFRREIGRGGN